MKTKKSTDDVHGTAVGSGIDRLLGVAKGATLTLLV